jgi:hypothetical protein
MNIALYYPSFTKLSWFISSENTEKTKGENRVIRYIRPSVALYRVIERRNRVKQARYYEPVIDMVAVYNVRWMEEKAWSNG